MKSSRVPGPRGFPLIGNLVDFASDPLSFLCGLANTYGDVASFRLPMGRVVLFNDPPAVRRILTDVSAFPRSGAYRALATVLGRGLLTTDGEFHARERRALISLFSRRESLRYADHAVRAGQRVCERLKHGHEVDVLDEMRHAALEVMFNSLFGVEIGHQGRQIFDAIDELELTFDNQLFLAAPYLFEYAPFGRAKRFRASRDMLRSLIARLISENERTSSTSEQMLPRMRQISEDGQKLSGDVELLIDQVLTLLLAGHDTTANTLAWAWHLIAESPGIEALLHHEWAARLNKRPPTIADLDALPVTEMVIRETLRLYPQAWLQGRRSVAEFEWNGRSFPAGTEVAVSAFVTQRDQRFFDRPDVFDPLRWSEGHGQNQPDFTYFPFGGGAHRCIGEYLAKTEAVLLLATIGQGWRFMSASSTAVQMRPAVTLKPAAGLKMIASTRDEADDLTRSPSARSAAATDPLSF
jgi:cytochrome P450